MFIGLMTPDGAIWFRYQRYLNYVIIISLQEAIKGPLKGNLPMI